MSKELVLVWAILIISFSISGLRFLFTAPLNELVLTLGGFSLIMALISLIGEYKKRRRNKRWKKITAVAQKPKSVAIA